jgi:integrase
MIRVTLIRPVDRKFFQAQWDDPVTGKTKTQSTKTTTKRDAERFAAKLEVELNSGEFKRPVAMTWKEFRDRYESEVGSTKAEKTRLKTQSMFNAVTELFDPHLLASVASGEFISRYAAKLREKDRGENREKGLAVYTVRSHLAELRKVLRWAVKLGFIQKMPHIEFPRKVGGMKGRPITEEEFDRMIACVPKLVLPEHVEGWRHYLRGLWFSGLRLEESMKLHWTNDRELMVDFTGRRPMFRIQAEHEKGRKFRLLPMTPDLAELLQSTPKQERHGFVFNPYCPEPGRKTGNHRPTPNHAGRIISDVGEKAGVRVSPTKFASAHDLRRAFGYRWSKLVMPKILQELMRHESIQTTMEFYVGSLAEDAADEVWKAVQRLGNTSGNTSPKTASDKQDQESQPTDHIRT